LRKGKSYGINKFKSYLRFVDTAKKSAIILGATGLTGGLLLQQLLADERYGSIRVFSRNSVGFTHPKLEEYTGDLLSLGSFRDAFIADEVYCCIGTTKAKTPDRELYKKIDYGIPVSAAQLCSENGIGTLLVISALGADPASAIFYNKIKGEMEKAVLGYKLPKTHLLQPALISGKRKERRSGEWIAKQIFKIADLVLVGPLKKYRSIHPNTIAKAMVWLANNPFDKARIPSEEIVRIAND